MNPVQNSSCSFHLFFSTFFFFLAFQHAYRYSFKITWKDEKAECTHVFPPSAQRLVPSEIQLICCTQSFPKKLLIVMVGWWLDKMISVVFPTSVILRFCAGLSASCMLQMEERGGKWEADCSPPSRKVLLWSRNGAESPCAVLVSEWSALERTWGLCSPAVSKGVLAISDWKWSLVHGVRHSGLLHS